MSVTYPDLPIVFPDGYDTGKFYRDPTITEMGVIADWNALISQKRFAEAQNLMSANPTLSECFPTADDWNKNLGISIGLERFFMEKVNHYVDNALIYKSEKWDSLKPYNENDVVAHNNLLWYAKQDNVSSEPVEGSVNWETLFDIKQYSDSITMIDGKPLSEGLVCAAFENPLLYKGVFLTEATIMDGYFYELRFTATEKLIADSTETKVGEDYITTIKIYNADGITVSKTITKTETKVGETYKTIIA